MWGNAGSISINGIGSSDIWQNELIRPGDTAGPKATNSDGTVLSATGYRVDDNTDLVVELPGRNFELTRNFQGNSRFLKVGSFGPTPLGGWTASIDSLVYSELVPVQQPATIPANDTFKRMGVAIVAPSQSVDTVAFQNYLQYKPGMVWESQPGQEIPPPNGLSLADLRTFRPLTPSMLRLMADKLTFRHPDCGFFVNPTTGQPASVTLPVWKLTDPGGGTSVFFRGCADDPTGQSCSCLVPSTPTTTGFDGDVSSMAYMPAGKLWQQRDEYGNLWTFEYARFPVAGGGTVPRLVHIYLGGLSRDDANTKAVVEFGWLVMDTGARLWHLDHAYVYRPYLDRAHPGERQWCQTDSVEYVYAGDASHRINAPWLGPPDSLVMVIKRTKLGQAMPDETRSGFNPRTSPPRTTVMLYRYALLGGQNGNPDSIQIRGAWSPEQVENLAREHWTIQGTQETLVDHGRLILTPGEEGTERDVERAAWGLMSLSDTQGIARPDYATGTGIALWRSSDRWTMYQLEPWFYGEAGTPPTGRLDCGRVQYEFSQPGDGGHTKRTHHEYDPGGDANDLTGVRRIAKFYADDPPNPYTSEFNYSLRNTVQRITTSVRRTDAERGDNELLDLTWTEQLRTTTRSEQRDLFALAYKQKAEDGSVGLQWWGSVAPFTVAELQEEFRGGSRARWWLNLHLFDAHNRPTKTIDAGALASEDVGGMLVTGGAGIVRLANWRVIAQHSDPAALGSLQESVYGDGVLLPPWWTSGIGGEMRSAMNPVPPATDPIGAYTANYPATMRVVKHYAGMLPDPPLPSAPPKLLRATQYRGPTLDQYGHLGDIRPDLPAYQELSRDGSDNPPPPQGNDPSRERTAYGFELRSNGAIATVSVSRPRESVAENGPIDDATVTTKTWIDEHGRVTSISRPGGVAEAFEYQALGTGDLTGKPIRHLEGGAIDPANGTFTAGGATALASSKVYDVSGNLMVDISADGVRTEYDYGLEPLPPGVSPPGVLAPTPLLCVSRLPHKMSANPDLPYSAPVCREWYNAQCRVLRRGTYDLASLSLDQDSGVVLSFTNGQELSRSESDYLMSGLTQRERAWAFASAGGAFPATIPVDPGSLTAFYQTSHVYDGNGNEVETVSPVGDLTKHVYDAKGRLQQTLKGGGTTAVLVEERFYDNETSARAGKGDGLLTLVKTYPDAGSLEGRGVHNWYDKRNRLMVTQPVSVSAGGTEAPAGPSSLTIFDNLDRPICTATLSQGAIMPTLDDLQPSTIATSSDAVSVKQTRYSHRGLAYRTLTLTGAASGSWLVSDRWSDDLGRELAVTSPGGASTKRAFDDQSRVVSEARVVDPAGATGQYALTFASATDIDTGCSLQRTDHTYLANKTLLGQTAVSQRVHSSIPASGSLPQGIGTDAASRVTTYVNLAYDEAARLVATVNYGTNAPTTVEGFTSAGVSGAPGLLPFGVSDKLSVPITADPNLLPPWAIVSRNAYNKRGQVEVASRRVDETHREDTRTYFDSLGRAFATVENCGVDDPVTTSPVSFSWNTSRWGVTWNGTPASDQCRVRSKVFDALGHVTSDVAHLRNGAAENVQVTSYRYAWNNAGESPVPCNSLLYETKYPDAATGLPGSGASDHTLSTYNALGEQATIQDQRGLVREFLRDAAGRTIADRVFAWGSNQLGAVAERQVPYTVDQQISQIATSYDGFGRTEAVISSGWDAIAQGYDPVQSNLDPAGGTAAQLLVDPRVRNFVKYSYNGLGQVTVLRQGAEGPEDQSEDERRREVRYGYALQAVSGYTGESGVVYQRLTQMEYPDKTAGGGTGSSDDTVVQMQYTGLVDGEIGRVSALAMADGGGAGAVIAKYARLGVGVTAVTDLPLVGVQLDRTIDSAGNRDYGSSGTATMHGRYGGWDRFGRVLRNSWAGPGYGPQPGSPPGPNVRQPLWQETYSYDGLSRKLSKDDARTNSGYLDQDWRYEYDGLDRVVKADRSQTVASAFQRGPGSKTWTLDEVGNWATQDTFEGGQDHTTETRAHNATNELKASDQFGGLFRFYDANGNLIVISLSNLGTGLQRERLFYDAWNRLVRVEHVKTGATDTVWYGYNGLHWKVYEHRKVTAYHPSTPPPGAPPVQDTVRWTFYSPAWQQLLEVVAGWSATPPTHPTATRREQQVWGLRGTDDALLRRIDTNADDEYTGQGDQSFYQLTDSSFSVVAHVDGGSGSLRQYIGYEAYGQTRNLLTADFDGDGSVTQDDLDGFNTARKEVPPLPSADFDGNGTVDSADYDAYFAAWTLQSTATPPIDESRINFAGYVRDPVTGYLLARNRWYDPSIGRWLTRDPAGYVDGLDLYLYGRGNPLSLVDPTGLIVRDTDLEAKAEMQAKRAAERAEQEAKQPGTRDEGYWKSVADGAAYVRDAWSEDARGNMARGAGGLYDGATGRGYAEDARIANDVANADSRRAVQQIHSGQPEGAHSTLEKSASEVEMVTATNDAARHAEFQFFAQGACALAIPAGELAAMGMGLKGAPAAAGGRLGSQATRDHVSQVAAEMESRGWKIAGGGGRGPEEYIPGPNGARAGSAYPDITGVKNGRTLRVNTVDTLSDGVTPTSREAGNAAKIRRLRPDDHLLLIPKP